MRDLAIARSDAPAAGTPAARALAHLAALQQSDGVFEAETVWNTMVLSQVVILRHILSRALGRPLQYEGDERARAIRYYERWQTPERDGGGGWGMHIESPAYVYFTALGYVALRLLGLPPEHPLCARARAFLRNTPGGVTAIPTWGKYWLSFIGLYKYEGCNPCAPELFLLPPNLPIHPDRFYNHTRYIYLPLAALYGMRYVADLGPITIALRDELYTRPFETIHFADHKDDIAETDLYVRPGPGLRAAFRALSAVERAIPKAVRRAAVDHCFNRIVEEQRLSNYQTISPVNGVLNCLAIAARDIHHPDLEPSLKGLEAWRWDDEDEGIRYAGARSQTWDTAFALQALCTNPAIARARIPTIKSAVRWLLDHQILDELPDPAGARRDIIRGGFCFNDAVHRWPVSDCAAEAVSGLLCAEQITGEPIPDDRLRLAADFILSRQNDDGGFGSYERRRGAAFLETVNPTELWGACMTERSYIECTASCVVALADLARARPHLQTPALRRAIAAGAQTIRAAQRKDGSFPGFWGICFTYGAWFAVRALRAAGADAHDPALIRAADWLAAHQRKDGGWGEHYKSCVTGEYVEHEQSQSVQTAWALLALLDVVRPESPSIRRGIDFLKSKQMDNGGFPREAVNGVFFGTAMHDYRLYIAYFPAWALAAYEARR